MDSDLLATCNALGYLEEDRYFKEPDCLDTVKCLIKYLHQEDNNNEIRIQLGSGHIVPNDLLPILRQYPDDNVLCAAVLRLLVNLTQPVLLCFGNKIPTETELYHNYLDVLVHNQAYKQDFSEEETWKVLAQKVYDILEKDWEDRTPDDSMTVERILVLCRNVLHVPPTTQDDKQAADNMSTHDRLIIAMHNAGIDSMILYLASSTTEQQWCLHVSEIISLLLKEQSPGNLINNAAERAREGDELKNMRLQEDRRKQMRISQQSSRHSRFGGTFVAKGKAALTDNNDLVLHKALQKCNNVTYDEGKNKLRKAKNKRPLIDASTNRRTTQGVRTVLKEFCIGLLENGYNRLMFSVKDKIARGSSEDHDETYYFSIVAFMMEFNRKYKFHIDQVSETIQLSTLHFIDVSIIKCMELMMTDKQECKTWGRRMHLALCCYKEFLLTLQQMQLSRNESYAESTKVLLNNIFYTSEYREIFVSLLRKYDESKLSHGFLDDLVQTTHLFIRLFEKYCKGNAVVVEKKTKKHRKKRQKNSTTIGAMSEFVTLTEDDKAQCWNEIENDIRNAAQEGDLTESGPVTDLFDPTSDVPEEEQQQKALVKIQNKLHSKCAPGAVVLLRQSRELWPEIDVFGNSDSTWEEDTSTLREICLADMAGLPGEDQAQREGNEYEEEEEEEVRTSSKEVEFNLNDYLRRFADPKVVQPYVTLLAKFDTNSPHTNHCVVKLLHRVSYDLKMYGILFQASVFRCFQKIFRHTALNSGLKELDGFGKFIMQKFFEVLPKNDKLFAELLFWKQSVTHVYELTEGYGSFSKAQGSKTIVVWSESERTELAQLYEEFEDSELDVVDCIVARITDESRTRRQVVKQLVNQGLVGDATQLKRKSGSRTFVWREHEEMELRRLFEEFQNSEDPLGQIMQMMSTKKSKAKVIDKMLSMGLVQDRKELYKRRKKGDATKRKKESAIMHAGGSDSEGEENRNEEPESESDDDSWTLIDLSSCIRKTTGDGFAEQINWVKSNLKQAIDDRNQSIQDDELQPLPLVPLTEEQEEAMQNSAFRKMLQFIGLQKPSLGQEMFWRIPSILTVTRLEESIQSLSQPMKENKQSQKDIGRPHEVLESLQNGAEISSLKRKRMVDSEVENDSDMETRKAEPDGFSTNGAKRRKRISAADGNDSDNFDEEALTRSGIPPTTNIEQAALVKNKRRLLIEDDSDGEENADIDKNPAMSSQSEEEEKADISISHKSRKRISVLEDDEDF